MKLVVPRKIRPAIPQLRTQTRSDTRQYDTPPVFTKLEDLKLGDLDWHTPSAEAGHDRRKCSLSPQS